MAWEAIPEELKKLKQWVCWSYQKSETGKPTKVPMTIGGYRASSTSPRDWYTFEDAVEAAGKFDGIGFVFTEDDPYCGIDLDDCIDNGELKDWAVPIAEHFDATYSEVSPSGNGIKYICTAKNPMDRGRKVSIGDGAVELYDRGRFFTLTGMVRGESKVVRRQPEVDWLVDTHMPNGGNLIDALTFEPTVTDQDKIARARAYLAEIDGAVSGSGGHDVTFRAACSLVLGFDLTTEQAFQLLATEYNPKCQPPWSEKELRHKVESANKQDGPRGGLLVDRQRQLVDLSLLIGEERTDDFDDEDFAQRMVPQAGLLRDVYDFYSQLAQRRSHVMGLAVAVSTCEVLFGRRIASHTDLRTNDYNVIIAPTNCGKEACEKTITKIFEAVDPQHQFIIPPDVQSGNGLLAAIAECRCCIWVSDEFGKVLASVLDKKQRNPYQAQIATHLLKLYGKADGTYGGAAHSAGAKHRIIQPHFCVLGLTTGSTLFESVDGSNVSDGLFGRIAFWPVKNRPRRRKMTKASVPGELVGKVSEWVSWQPSGNLGMEYPDPATLEMEQDALKRWERHSEAIDERMDEESETRNAIWGRVAARSMKLAMVHRAARMEEDPGAVYWPNITIEMQDIEWGIAVANWLARISCQLVGENFVDNTLNTIAELICTEVSSKGEVSAREVSRMKRKFVIGDVMAAAKMLEGLSLISIQRISTGGRPRTIFRGA
jgi:hypothetical protein